MGIGDDGGGNLVIAEATIVDARQGTLSHRNWVVISDGRIDRIVPPMFAEALGGIDGYPMIDAEGVYLTPGFVDLHADLGDGSDPCRPLHLMLALGITAFLREPGQAISPCEHSPRPLERTRTAELVERATDPGVGLHRWFDELAAGGAGPTRVLQMATSDAADLLGATGDFGDIVPGQRADLVFLGGNPLVSISNLHNIVGLVRAGHLYEAADLAALGSSVASGGTMSSRTHGEDHGPLADC